jgi:hypothetical protein
VLGKAQLCLIPHTWLTQKWGSRPTDVACAIRAGPRLPIPVFSRRQSRPRRPGKKIPAGRRRIRRVRIKTAGVRHHEDIMNCGTFDIIFQAGLPWREL